MCEKCPERNPPNNDICVCLCKDVVIVESFIGEEYEYCRTCDHVFEHVISRRIFDV